MTVAELIAKLQDFPPNLDVWLVDEKEGITFPMQGEINLVQTSRSDENHVELL